MNTTAESPILVGMAANMAEGKHSTFPLWRFINVTVEGSRQYRHMYSIMESLEPGTIPSIAQVFDNQATSTYEKDGTARGKCAICLPLCCRVHFLHPPNFPALLLFIICMLRAHYSHECSNVSYAT